MEITNLVMDDLRFRLLEQSYSSKLCSHWGWKNDDLTLSDWEWWCHGCGVLNERDLNAARNCRTGRV